MDTSPVSAAVASAIPSDTPLALNALLIMAHVHGVAASGEDFVAPLSANGRIESGGVAVGGALSRFEGARRFPFGIQIAFAFFCLRWYGSRTGSIFIFGASG